MESLRAWRLEQGIEDERFTVKLDLGLSTTYLASAVTGTSVPDGYSDVAVPFA